MPFTMQEAREWATYLHEAEAKATDLDALKIIEDIRESIDRDAEAGGWHSEWEAMTAADGGVQADDAADLLGNAQDEARAVLEEMRKAARELPVLTSDILHRARVLKYMEINGLYLADHPELPTTVPELVLWLIDRIEIGLLGSRLTDTAHRYYLEFWPDPFGADRSYLTRIEVERIAEFFDGFGICGTAEKLDALSLYYRVTISW